MFYYLLCLGGELLPRIVPLLVDVLVLILVLAGFVILVWKYCGKRVHR